MKISLFLQMAAEADPERIGLVCDGRRWSYGALLRAARGAAVNIANSGCAHVALLDESSEADPIALFGAAFAGVPYVPLNYRLADADLAALLHCCTGLPRPTSLAMSNACGDWAWTARPHVPPAPTLWSQRTQLATAPLRLTRRAKVLQPRYSPVALPPHPKPRCCATAT